MKSKKYLNDSLKEYYSKSLIREIENKSIDEGIEDELRIISNSENIRPMFSKRGKHGRNNKSYLSIAFTDIVEKLLLYEIQDYFIKVYSKNRRVKFEFLEIPPFRNDGREVNEKNLGANWLIDEGYFDVNSIRFELKGGDEELHDRFWNDLADRLSI